VKVEELQAAAINLDRAPGVALDQLREVVLEVADAELVERHLDLRLQPPQRPRVAVARRLTQPLTPQRPLHLGMKPCRIGLIGSVHTGSLVCRETASGGRTDRVRETRVYQAAA